MTTIISARGKAPSPITTTPRNNAAAPLLSRLLSFSARTKKERSAFDDEGGRQERMDGRSNRMINKMSNDSFRNNDNKSGRGEEDEQSSCMVIGDNDDSVYDACATIDDSMFGLHTCLITTQEQMIKQAVVKPRRQQQQSHNNISFGHDWILDGTDDSSEGEDDYDNELLLHNNHSMKSGRARRRKLTGDPALDQAIGMLEIENASYTTSGGSNSCGDSSMLDYNDFADAPTSSSSPDKATKNGLDEKEEEAIEFEADFSCLGELDDGNGTRDGGLVSGDVFDPENINLQNGVLFEYERKEVSFEVDEDPEACSESAAQDIMWSSPGYKPPQSIECLVSDLDAELNVTIEKCLALSSPDTKLSDAESDDEGSSSDHDGNCAADLLDALNDDHDPEGRQHQPGPPPNNSRKEYKQPLLMSSLLLESLPMPVPSASSEYDPVASFTRRVQKYHTASKPRGDNVNSAQLEDELLEEKLADTIHSGYYAGTGDDCDSDRFDSIVLEEVLNVPWPFHLIDLKESILGEEDLDSSTDDPDSDESSIDHLNFDTYVSNRLSELDFANGEIMSCLLSRVSQKEEAINEGVQSVFAAELNITTALIFAKSSREFLHRAKNGYSLDGVHGAHSDHQHNVVSGGLDVVQYADNKDRLRYLLETIDLISTIRDQEEQWWEDVSAKTITPQRFQKLVDDTKRLKEMVRGEEVLNHAVGLRTMRDRMNHLPDALLGRIEDSAAELFARILRSDKTSMGSFDEYFLEYEMLLQSWLSCYQLRADNDSDATNQSQPSVIVAEWSACILSILCFEVGRAFAYSMIDSYYEERIKAQDNGNHAALDEIKSQLGHLKFGPKGETDVESLSHRLLVMRLGGGHHTTALSLTFFHLCSRLVELMNLYCVVLQWHKAIMDRVNPVKEYNSSNITGDADRPDCESIKIKLSHTMVSSMSSDKQSSSSTDESAKDDTPQGETSERPVPETLEFTPNVTSSLVDFEAIHKSLKLIRRALWKKCEVSLINLIESYMAQGGDLGVQSGDSTDSTTSNLRLTYDVLLQFTSFTSHFLYDDEEECSALENELLKLYQRHCRSVHIEAMKTTGTLLRHESWQLAPLELSGDAFKVEENGNSGSHHNKTIMQAVYEAVRDLLLGSTGNESNKSDCQLLITARAESCGYKCCASFVQFLEDKQTNKSEMRDNDTSPLMSACIGMTSSEFSSKIISFVEMKPCGERALSILTQSSANGLLKWTARLLAVGKALPLVADDASAAVMTLFDLYILTVFRLCAGSKLNEDVLIGFGRGTKALSSSSSVSLTMEADTVAPFPGEKSEFMQTKEFVESSRRRLQNMVNLDKFQSSSDDIYPASPRSKNAVFNSAKRLEKEAAAAYSCFFVAILLDVVSKIFQDGESHQSQQQPLWTELEDMTTSIEKNEDTNDMQNEESLEAYAIAAVSIMPNFVRQIARFATVNAMSGKELIFQIICCGRVWDNNRMQEQSNAYVEHLCSRCAFLWGYMSSSMRLPLPALKHTWNQLVCSAFMVLLEGFSKVPKCSTEGRSLMSMDLATLSHGLIPKTVQAEVEDDYPTTSPPPQACREDMMRYVDTFIKVFYFPNEDVINWIQENWANHHLDHSLSLITSKPIGSKYKRLMSRGDNAVIEIYNRMN